MKTLHAFGHVVAVALVVVLMGCSSTKNKPVYTEVPGSSVPSASLAATPAAASEAQAAPAPAAQAPQPAAAEKPELIVTPDDTLTGSIVSVNEAGRFVVLRFPLGHMPAVDSKMFVYRQGMKVAELKVTGPQKDDHTVADIRTGECRVNDEVRDR